MLKVRLTTTTHYNLNLKILYPSATGSACAGAAVPASVPAHGGEAGPEAGQALGQHGQRGQQHPAGQEVDRDPHHTHILTCLVLSEGGLGSGEGEAGS